jgi:hypothetical protein
VRSKQLISSLRGSMGLGLPLVKSSVVRSRQLRPHDLLKRCEPLVVLLPSTVCFSEEVPSDEKIPPFTTYYVDHAHCLELEMTSHKYNKLI